MYACYGSSELMMYPSKRQQMRLGSLEEHPLLISEPSWQSKENRERWTELAFEGYGCPAFYSVDKNVLTSFALGKGTSIVLDVGEDVTSCMPIYDGFVIRKGEGETLQCFFTP
jgi:actin-related protein